MANLVRLAVPNNGTLEKVYINKNYNDILTMLNSLTYDSNNFYVLYASASSFVYINKLTAVDIKIEGYINGSMTTIFSTEINEADGRPKAGWYIDYDSFEVNDTLLTSAEFNGITFENIGIENSKLANLFSITPYSYENNTEFLSDMGNAIRSKLDTTISLKGKDMPNWVRSITTNKALEVSTSEEMDALLIDENIGLVYKYIGVTNDKYTYGKLYTIEEV